MNKLISKIKQYFKKINLVFIVHAPQPWPSLKTICDSAIKDRKFNVYILTFDSFSNECYNFFHQKYGNKRCSVIKYTNQQEFDKIKADYIFFQVPYMHFYPNIDHKTILENYKVCYMHYGMLLFKGDVEKTVLGGSCDFFSKLSFIFAESDFIAKKYLEYHPKANVVMSGYPRFDEIGNDFNNDIKNKKFNIIWTPRWEIFSSTCNFFDYKDLLLDYAKSNSDIDFIFRPHPLALKNYVQSQAISQEEIDNYLKNFDDKSRIKIDLDENYIKKFCNSNLLITDMTSLIAEYFFIGKPIIYCNKTNVFNEFGLEIAKGLYWANNWQELKETIEMLKTGKDPLLKTRQKIIKELFFLKSKGAGNFIKNFLKKDFKKNY